MKVLLVGDPHIRVEDLREGGNLINLILETVRTHKPDGIIFMGDLFHNFELVNVEVAAFWKQAIVEIKMAAGRGQVIVIRGNHDGPHDPKPGVHALAYLQNFLQVQVIDKPEAMLVDRTPLLFVPFMRDHAEFVEACSSKLPNPSTVYCHQEFAGAAYDNGQLAQEGVDPAAIPQTTVISGHIHTGQEFGKVWYVGAPRWMTASDANKDRFLWLVEHDDVGAVVARTPIPTDPWCQRMVHIADTEAKPENPEGMKAEWKVVVDIRGTEAWISQRVPLWQGRARIRTFREGERKIEVRESEGIDVAFFRYVDFFKPAHGTDKEFLRKMAISRMAEPF